MEMGIPVGIAEQLWQKLGPAEQVSWSPATLARPPAAHPHAVPPTSGNRARLLSAKTRAQTELSASPHARRCPPSQGKSPPRFPRRSRPARTYLGPPGPVEGSLREPRSGQSSGRGYRAFTRRERLQNGLAAPTGPAPTPSFPRHFGPPPPPSRAFAGALPVSPTAACNRLRVRRGAEGRAPGGALLSLHQGCARPRSAVPRAPGRGRGARGPAGWARAERGRREAAWSPVEPPGKEAGAQREGLCWAPKAINEEFPVG
ncbi:TPA: hypothetical protein BOS_12385 [Bos taurus]|nr:TPA: hypothetical protein BOS_12385 [Bos taurus]